MEDFQDRGIWKVAVREPYRTIVGFQVLEPYASYTRAFDHVGILGTYVDLDLRRQGIARRLFAATFDAAREKGYEKIFTYVRADNPTALQTYLDPDALVAWSSGLKTKAKRSFKASALIGRGSGEAFQIGFSGQGFVVVGNAKRQAKIDGQYIDEILIEKWL